MKTENMWSSRSLVRCCLAAFLLALVFSCGAALAEETPVLSAEDEKALASPVATVNGKAITLAQVLEQSAHAMLPEAALEELIDLELLKEAAAANKLPLPAEWSPDSRAALELAVAQALGLDAAKPRIALIVDHAWLKDADDAKERAAGRTRLEKLRALVVDGATIPQAFAQLQLDGALWHIGDHEEYPYEVLPAEARDLPPGGLSAIIPGDGGLHLLKVYQPVRQSPPPEEVSSPLREHLRRGAVIVRQ